MSDFIRHIPFDNIPNFRDMGGYPTTEDRIIKPGVFYRSGQPGPVTSADKEKFDTLNIKEIHDLRLESEIVNEPMTLFCNTSTVNYNLQVSDIEPLYDAIRKNTHKPTAREACEIMLTGYSNSITNESERFAKLLKNLAIKSDAPVLIHCAAGKDRTGIAVALILLALGVARNTIIADYVLTNELYPAKKEVIKKAEALKSEGARAFDHAVLAPLHHADPDYITVVLDRIEFELGGSDSYLMNYLSMTKNEINALCERFLL